MLGCRSVNLHGNIHAYDDHDITPYNAAAVAATAVAVVLVPHYRIVPRKVSPGQQFTGKNPHRPAAARAGRIFAGKFSAVGDFCGAIL